MMENVSNVCDVSKTRDIMAIVLDAGNMPFENMPFENTPNKENKINDSEVKMSGDEPRDMKPGSSENTMNQDISYLAYQVQKSLHVKGWQEN